MRHLYKNIVLGIFLLMAGQCVVAANNTDHNQLLAGTWSSMCASNDNGQFIIETFVFNGNTANYSVNTFRDKNCTQQISKLATYRTFKLGDKVPNLNNTYKLDYVFKKVTMTYTDSSAIKAANETKEYGFDNWMLNQPKDVSGMKHNQTASIEHAVGEKFFTIVQIQNNKLFMGDYNSGTGTSETGRLSKIYNVPFIKN